MIYVNKIFYVKVIKRLDMYGAFHTWLMKGAAGKLKDLIHTEPKILYSPPRFNVHSNFSGRLYGDFPRWWFITEAITDQIFHPVKWEQNQQTLLYHIKEMNERSEVYI